MQDLIAGHVQLMFDAISTSLPNIKAGLIRPIAWTGAKPSAVLPDLPTIAASGLPDYDTTSWLAMFAPAGTPPDLIAKVSDEVKTILNKPEVKDRQVAQGVEIVASTPQQLDEGRDRNSEMVELRQEGRHKDRVTGGTEIGKASRRY